MNAPLSKEELFTAVQQMLTNMFGIQAERVTLDADLYDDLEFDSLDTIDLMIGVEKLLGRRLGANVLADARTVGDAVNEIYQLQREVA